MSVSMHCVAILHFNLLSFISCCTKCLMDMNVLTRFLAYQSSGGSCTSSGRSPSCRSSSVSTEFGFSGMLNVEGHLHSRYLPGCIHQSELSDVDFYPFCRLNWFIALWMPLVILCESCCSTYICTWCGGIRSSIVLT